MLLLEYLLLISKEMKPMKSTENDSEPLRE